MLDEFSLQEERRLTQEKERELENLAKEEMELIHRLQQKQVEQRRAYSELESALGLGHATPAKGTKVSSNSSMQVVSVAWPLYRFLREGKGIPSIQICKDMRGLPTKLAEEALNPCHICRMYNLPC